MPITFQQPSPTSAAISIGAGQADINTREFSALAGLVESYGRLAAQAYGRGGGGGGGRGEGSSGGAVQVLPTSDYGATAQVEQQANREQRSMDLGFVENQANQRLAYSLAPENDPVARHIQMQENYADRRQIQAQQADRQAQQAAMQGLVGPGAGNVQPGPTPSPQAPPASWEVQDEQDLVKEKQKVRQAQQDADNGKVLPETAAAIQETAMQKIHELTARKDAATQQAQQKKEQELLRSTAVLNGIDDRNNIHTQQTFKQLGTSKLIQHFDPQGNYQGLLQWDKKNQKYDHIKGSEPPKQAAEKEEKPQTDSQLMLQAKAHAEATVPFNKDKDAHAAALSEETQKQYGELKQQQQSRITAKETAKRMKEADPQVIGAYKTFTAPFTNEAGTLDLQKANPQQLHQIVRTMSNPNAVKKLGITDQTAARMAQIAQRVLARKLNPQPEPEIAAPPPDTHTPTFSEKVMQSFGQAAQNPYMGPS